MRRLPLAVVLGVVAVAGLSGGPALAQSSPSSSPGMSSEDLNTALGFAKAGIDQARAYAALPIRNPRDVRYACQDGKSLTMKYMTAGDTPLAAIVLDGKTLVFANVLSGSGARYASGRYVWWTQGPTGFLADATLPANRNEVYRDCSETR